MRKLFVGTVFVLAAAAAAAAQSNTPLASTTTTFTVTPAQPAPWHGPEAIVLTGLPPEVPVRITAERLVHSELLGGRRVLFRSEAVFNARADGSIDLAKAMPRSGSYSGADLRGLFWAMRPSDDPVPDDALPGRVRLRAWLDDRAIAETVIEFKQALDAVQVENVAAFPGATLARLPGTDQRPVVIVLSGAEGGNRAGRDEGPRLAAEGYAVLGLPYYSPAPFPGAEREFPDLPGDFVDIPVDRLAQAYDWLRTRSDLDSDRIAVYGASKGAEFALIAGSRYRWIDAVVAIAPSDVVWEGWGWGLEPGTRASFSFAGKPLPFVPYQGWSDEFANYTTGGEVHMRRPHDRGRAAHPGAAVAARIPVERIRGPVLLAAGHDDQLWNAGMMAHNIAERRAQAGLNTVTLIYPEAGHYLNGNGWAPTTHYDAGQKKSGGTPAGNAHAQVQVRAAISAFLRRTLLTEAD